MQHKVLVLCMHDIIQYSQQYLELDIILSPSLKEKIELKEHFQGHIYIPKSLGPPGLALC